MKAEYINPFIESVTEVFAETLEVELERGKIGIVHNFPASTDLVTLISVNGEQAGIVAISLPVSTALNIVGKLTRQELRIVDEAVTDRIDEFTTLVALNAREKFSSMNGGTVSIGSKALLRGNFYKGKEIQGTWLEVTFESNLGPIYLRAVIESA
ncbi:MAG TPA: chemotaxis protein CheX [bacterium]|jgi:CheY-specific phosphatase CheX